MRCVRVVLLVVLVITLSAAGCGRPKMEPAPKGETGRSVIVVDEPSVRLEAELNLHYKTFSDYRLTDEYLRRWLHKYNYLPGSKVMSDSEFFSAIDILNPNYENVITAFGRGNIAEAKESLISYFINRESPCIIDPGKLNPSRRDKTLQIADDFLANPNFPNVVWPREKYGRGTKDGQWNWVSHLYMAYRYTKDIKYLAGTMKAFSWWYENVRPPAGKPRIWLSPSFINNPWDSHQAGRKITTLALFDGLLKTIPYAEIPVESRILLYKSVIEHARFLIAVNPGFRAGNIQLLQMLCLLEAGIYFPEFKESREWIDFAWQSILKHAWIEILPDGGYFERATGYNNAVIRFFRRALQLARIAGLATPQWLRPKLRKAHEWTIKVYSPILNLTPVGDSSMGSENFALPYLIDGALLFPCPEFKFFVAKYPEEVKARAKVLFGDEAQEMLAKYDAVELLRPYFKTPIKGPHFRSVNLPDTGWSVMRSDWSRDARYLLFDWGSNEPWHCHRDGLGFSIFAFGEPLITDCGHGGGYQSDRSKKWYKETISHNLVQINGMSQRKVTDGKCDKWVSAGGVDYVNATHDGYKYLGAYCRRRITFVKPDYWIITDNLTEKMCQTTGFHECSWLAHFQPTTLTIDEKSKQIHTNNPGANILLVPARPASLTVTDSKGWMQTPKGEVNDAPYISYSREGDLPVDFEIIAFPYKGGKVPDVKVERINTGRDAWRCKCLKITTSEGVDYYLENLSADYYFKTDEKDVTRKVGDFDFIGEMALMRMTKDGKIKSAFVIGGKHNLVMLKFKGKSVIPLEKKVAWKKSSFGENSVSSVTKSTK